MKKIENWEAETEVMVERATGFFRQGCNCSQSVAMAFADYYDIPMGMITQLSASFGGGIGRMRETCGSACAIFMLSALETVTEEASQERKKQNYEAVQRLAADFRRETGSIVCKELLGLNKKRADGTIPEIEIVATPEARTEEYYRKRPCIRMVEVAVRIYMRYLKELREKEVAV